MGDGTEPLAMEDSDWRYFCESATREIDADIDAALIRCASGTSTRNDAILLAGYLNRGHLFETHVTDDQRRATYERAAFMENDPE